MADELESGLSAAEEAYFESGGATALDTEPSNQEPTPGAPPATEPEGQDGQTRDDKGRFVQQVPHSVFHAEREEHKRTKAERDELIAFRAAIEERQRWAAEAMRQQQPKDKPPILDPEHPEYDIFKANKWMAGEIQRAAQANAQREQAAQQSQQEREADARVWNHWQSDAAAYAKENPDFGPAAKWLAETRDKQLQAFAAVDPRFANPQMRNQQIDAELKQIIIGAAGQRRSSAQAVYEIAKQYGYQAQASDIQLPDKLKSVQVAQQASRSVGQATGAAGGGELSMADILAMPRNEFDTWYADAKNQRYYDRLMGA